MTSFNIFGLGDEGPFFFISGFSPSKVLAVIPLKCSYTNNKYIFIKKHVFTCINIYYIYYDSKLLHNSSVVVEGCMNEYELCFV